MDYSSCPNCNTPIKDGVFNSNKITSAHKTEGINLLFNKSLSAYCDKCFEQQRYEADQKYVALSRQLSKNIEENLDTIPLITLQHPHAWDYTVLKMVTAQCVTGEGALTEFISSWNEFWGTQSKRMNNKLKGGENICMSKLRLEAIAIGGNAIIGTDIDYAEVGGLKGMLMVCMSGTAVRLNNPEIISPETPEILISVIDDIRKFERLKSFDDVFLK